ncbi:MAG: AI-2E family transporter [Sphaerobacter sp.]|nr:AI-2E family transporter [Sphaerobacter sp.]
MTGVGQDGPREPQRDALLRRALPLYSALVLAIFTAAGLSLLLRLRGVLLILFISLLFAAAVARPASQLERLRIPRGIAAVIVYLVAFGVVVGIGWFVLPPLFAQVATLVDDLPRYVDRYQSLRVTYERLRQQYPELAPFEAQVTAAGARLLAGVGQRLTELPSDLFGVFLDLLSVFIISMLLVTTRERILAFILSLTHPAHRATTERVLRQMWERIGYYVRAKLIVMAIIGALTYVALRLIGLPYAVLLAIVVALGEIIPRIGPWLARIPLLVIAAFEGLTTFGIVLAVSVLLENAKGYFISPWVEGDQLDIHPLLVFIAVLVGASLLGVAGAFVAVPAAAMLQVLCEEVIFPWRRAQVAAAEAELAAQPAGREPDA